MSNLKDTDFDDLFRRASDKYPLRTDSSDWDRMAAALEKDPSPDTPDDSDNTDKRRRRRFFWWFLLLPLAGVGYYVAHTSGHGSGAGRTNGTAKNNITLTKPGAAKNATTENNAGGNTTAGDNTTAGGNATATDNNSGTSNSKDNQGAPPTGGATTTVPNASRTNPAGGRNGASPKAVKPHTTEPTALAPAAGQAGAGTPLAVPRMVTSTNPKSKTKTIRSTEGDIPVRPQTDASAEGAYKINSTAAAGPLSLKYADINQQRIRTAGPFDLNVAVNTKPLPAPNKPAPNKKDSTKKKTRYLYAGLIAAPDLSTVKLQKATGLGTTFGALFGFAFNDHWAIETGAYLDRKRYYTDGEYFSTKSVNFNTSNYKLLNVDGTCYMWEIPLNVRYIFNPAGKTRWFATAGLSTYLMNRENYTYAYEYIGSTWQQSKTWNIKKPSQYPFSIVGISAGLEQSLGKLGSLRIEPYARLPLGGIGTGKLSIMSTGINIGITRRLWQKK